MTIAEIAPSLLAGLDVPGCENTLGLPRKRRTCLLLVDGLGHHLLREHADHAPFLASMTQREIDCGFPSSTATSLASIGTGLCAGEHGIVGYTFETGGEVLNALSWARHDGRDLKTTLVPEEVQPNRTVFERAAEQGIAVSTIAPYIHATSGLTRAALRGAWFRGSIGFGDLAVGAAKALQADRAFCYAYHADLDAIGHVYGPGSEEWLAHLEFVDALTERIARRLPKDAALVVTADHGMVTAGDRIDYDREPVLRQGVRAIAGEPRVRYLHTGSTEVLATWKEFLGDRADVRSRDEAIEAGWFGPVAPFARERIGDVVVAMKNDAVVVRTEAERRLSALTGFHGSRTRQEMAVPLLVHVS